ncbi:sarcosine oxidase subunit beta [Herbaspirillum sp. Sphag1AN]|nr:sarcosine oxidase subunit beta [Herbaspirillum sp. Sphag1AN]MBB3247048.1 sarcosine oxidase subunit beta [Herbaspirillum sp. Sphag64]
MSSVSAMNGNAIINDAGRVATIVSAAQYQADVIIVGGGIMGSAAAFFLRQRGRSVILLERGLLGQQASGTNFGNVRRQGRNLLQIPLANRSLDIWRKLPQLIGEDVEFLPSGHMRVCYGTERLGMFEDYALRARELGLDLEIFSGKQLRERFPFLGPQIGGGSYSPLDGHANPRLAAPAFGRAAARAGAQIFENTEVDEVEKDGEDFRATATDGRVFRAPAVLIAAGAWANRLSSSFGESVNLVAHGPQMGVTEPVPYGLKTVIGVSASNDLETLYFRQIPRGNIIFGGGNRGPAYPDLKRAYVRPENTLNQLYQLQRIAPALRQLNLLRVWSGIESYLPDDLPIMGTSTKEPGLHYAFGFCGAGFQLGPGVGDVMAELIDTGSTVTPIEAFSIRRFFREDFVARALQR